jgi:MoxR-like ATPase
MNPNREIELLITNQTGKTSSYRLKPGAYLMGRNQNCQIRFPPQERGVSRQHARLTVEAGEVRIEDLDSSSGTMVNGKITGSAVLQDGDVISIAGYTLRVAIPEDRAPSDAEIGIFTAPSESVPAESVEALEADLRRIGAATRKLLDVLGSRIVGQEEILRAIWATILAKGHCLLVGVPGLAKTLMVSTFAEALGLKAKRIQFTPDLLPSDIIGSNVIHETEDGKRSFEFVQGPIFTQLLLADEINRAPPKTQSALLEAMQERQVTVGNRSFRLPEPFFVIATQNPIEQEGTYPLPEAQQDRFMLCLYLEYPERDQEVDILLQTTGGKGGAIPEVHSFKDILEFQEIVNGIAVSRELAAYSADLVRATRPGDPRAAEWIERIVEWGAGPRAGQSVIRIAKAMAAMDGRPAISSDDIRAALLPAMRHRISCNFRSRAEGLDERAIIERVLEEVPRP